MDNDKIVKMLEYCGMSYKNIQPEIFDKIIFINDQITDVQCFLRIQSDKMIITFRGSDSRKDWIINSKFWRSVIPYNNYQSKIRVHRGFISAYKSNSVRGRIQKEIEKNKIKKVALTGHSYGAALAILCAVDLEYNFPKNDYEVIVFGCPRVGNKYFQKSYNVRVFKTLRVENANDWVTKVPFACMGYHHVGASLKIGGQHKFSFPNMHSHALHEYYPGILKL
ncbi:MAG: lipase family protein [Clostridia bacterium]|nr:lipase family protein [Clostridia bacterium]